MRRPLWAAGAVLMGAFLACSFDPTRTCENDGDCRNGGTCDPGTKTCVAAGGQTPPTFVVVTSAAPARQTTTKLTVLDPGAPDGGVGAFRRDETVRVTVWSDDSDVAPESVALAAVGIAGGAAAPPVSVPLVTCAPDNPAATKAFCREGALSLGPPLKFDAFRGAVTFTATGADTSGSSATASTAVNVTRWKWRYAAGAPIYTTPAIADDGTIVFGTSGGASGSLFALTPEGGEKWPPLPLGPIEASPAIGAARAGAQLVFAGTARATNSILYGVALSDGSDAGTCLGVSGAGFAKPFLSGLALLPTPGDTGPLDSVIGLASGARLVTFRPQAQGTTDPYCLEAAVAFQQTSSETIVSDGLALFLGAADNTIRSFLFDSTSINWIKNTGWGVSGTALLGDSELGPLAITSSELVASVHPLGVATLKTANGAATALGPDGGIAGEASGPVVLNGSVVFADANNSAPRLWRIQLGPRTEEASSTNGPNRAVPLAGADGTLYLVGANGYLDARGPSLDTLWMSQLVTSGGFLASPTIDCVRDGGVPISAKTGVLYAASQGGALFAVIVDSPGLDTTAPWPKYQHDIRNTGNPNTPITACP
jgi:hypothetical protein